MIKCFIFLYNPVDHSKGFESTSCENSGEQLIHGRLSKVGEYAVTLFEKYGIEYKEDDF